MAISNDSLNQVFFFSSGDEDPKIEIIPEELFSSDLTHLMSGMESSTFGFDVSTKSFSMRRKCVVKSISLETLQSYAENFIQVISILKF
jgi:hypothetical protein